MATKPRGLYIESLEARQLLAVDFLAGTLVAPEINRVDIPLGLTSGVTEPMVTVNAADPGMLALSNQSNLVVTMDAGGTFSNTTNFNGLLPAGSASNGDTDTAFDSQGRLFWTNLVDPGPGRNVGISQLNPAANPPAQIGATNNPPNPANNGDDKQFLAADTDPFGVSPFADNLYVSFQRFGVTPGEWEVFVSRSTNQGAVWSNPVQLSNFAAEGLTWPSDVAAAPNGDVYVAYHSQPDINDNELEGNAPTNPNGVSGQTFVLRSTDGGQTFPQKNLAFLPGQSDITFNRQDAPAGNIPGTRFWTVGAAQPWVLPDPVRGGNIYVVTNDDPDNNHGVGDDGDVVIARSTDNGVTWTRATIPDGAAGTLQVFPTASIDQFGNLVVSWYDNRRGLTNGNGNFVLDVFATYSVDGGVTWADAFMVSDPSNPLDPDVGVNQRFPNNGQPFNPAVPGQTSRIGEYFGIDNFGGTAYVAFNRNNSTGAGQTEAFLDAFAINGSLVVDGDDNGVVTNDQITIRAISGNADFVEVLVNDVRQYAGLKDGVAQGIRVNGLAGNDTLTIDYSNGDPVPVGGITFDGGAGAGDQVVVVGDGNNHGFYFPSSSTPGDGRIEVDGRVINFLNLQPVTIGGFQEFTLVTPNSNDNLSVDSPAANRNRVSGMSGEVAIEALTFFDVSHFKIDTATHDNPLANSNDSVIFTSDLVASNLQSFTIETGQGSDTVNASTITAAGRTGVTVLAGEGDDTLIGGALADRFDGGDGSDQITGNAGNDTINGGDGADHYFFEGLGAGVNDAIILLAGTTLGQSGGPIVRISNASNGESDEAESIEEVIVNTNDSTGVGPVSDLVTINSLAGTDVAVVRVESGLENNNRVQVNGTDASETITVGGVPGNSSLEQISGLGFLINLDGFASGNSDSLVIEGNGGDDVIKADEATLGASAPLFILNGGEGNDFLSADAVLNGGPGNDMLVGGAGSDSYNGGAGDDTLVVSGGNDVINGDTGFDVVLYRGTEAGETLNLNENASFIVTISGLIAGTIDLDADNDNAVTVERIDIEALGGNDTSILTGLTVVSQLNLGDGDDSAALNLLNANSTVFGGLGNDSIDAAEDVAGVDGTTNAGVRLTMYGGPGSDNLRGAEQGAAPNANAGDLLYGGPGNDILEGGRGQDQLFGEEDSDLLLWIGGDGSDLMEGGAGDSDKMEFRASAGADRLEVLGGGLFGATVNPAPNIFTFATLEDASRTIFALNSTAQDAAGVFLNLGDIEDIEVDALGGADQVTVNNQANTASSGTAPNTIQQGTDLSSTTLRGIDIDLGAADAANDFVDVHGRLVDDEIDATVQAGAVDVAGFVYSVRILNAVAANDRLVLHGQDGNDDIKAAVALENTIAVTINGDAGDDFLSADATLNGGPGNDTLVGGAGPDTLNGDAGDDLLIGGGGVDTFNGGADFDTILISGTPGNDTIDVFQDTPSALVASNYTFTTTLNGGAAVQEFITTTNGALAPADPANLPTVEQIRILAGDGNDAMRVTHADAYVDNDLTAAVGAQMLRFDVDGGGPTASDNLVVRDDGLGDLVLVRQGVDDRSGRITVAPARNTLFGEVVYRGIENLDITPLNSVTGGTGTDGNGRVLVFQPDAFEMNDNRLIPTQITDLQVTHRNPTIDPGQGGFVPADEDWYEFRPTKVGTFRFDVLFDTVGTLANNRPGLPGNGNLTISVYNGAGQLIVHGQPNTSGDGVTATFSAADDGSEYFLRVLGGTEALADPTAINTYTALVTEVDLLGPQVYDPDGGGPNQAVQVVTGGVPNPTFNLFDVKPTQGPTPVVDGLLVNVRDLLTAELLRRAPGNPASEVYGALLTSAATNTALYSVVGDAVGQIAISSVTVVNAPTVVNGTVAPGPAPAPTTTQFTANGLASNPVIGDLVVFTSGPASGQIRAISNFDAATNRITLANALVNAPNANDAFQVLKIATATIQLNFVNPLPDDRYTLTISDSVRDPAGNRFDGESNFAQPVGNPQSPSGDGVSGGDFVARFTVDTRPEIGTWAGGSIWVDINGNGIWDPNNADQVNRDIVFTMGYTLDDVFAGNFPDAAGNANGFDKLAVFGNFKGDYRWLIDQDSDGAYDLDVSDPLANAQNISGMPFAIDWDGNPANGDNVALFTGTTFYFDTDGNYQLDRSISGNMRGAVAAGDIDGDGHDDLVTWLDDVFYVDLWAQGGLTGNWDVKFGFGFIGAREKPVIADMNKDGFDDIGLWVPDREGQPVREASEWYFLVSYDSDPQSPGNESILDRIRPTAGGPMIDFTPTPFAEDIYYQYGDEFALPVVGNFDPPIDAPHTPPPGGNLNFNTKNVFDVNADGIVTTRDLLAVVSDLQLRGARELTAPAGKPPYVDVNMDGRATIADAARWLQQRYRQAQSQGQAEGEGEGPLVSFGDLENPQRDEAPLVADALQEAPGQTVAPIAALGQLRQVSQQNSQFGRRSGAPDQSLEGLLEEIAQDVLLSWRR